MIPSRRPSRTSLLLAAAASFGLFAPISGCSFDRHRSELKTTFASGRFDIAARELDRTDVIRLYGSRNRILYELDRGAVAFAQQDFDKTIEVLNQAEDRVELVREKTAADTLGQWAINDTTATYIAEPYEDMYINVFKLMAQLGAGRLSGGATVEARRLGSKADRLRDTYLKYKEQVQQESATKLKGRAGSYGGLVATNDDGNFIESPLGTFLAAVTFMKTGNPDLQGVAARRLVESIRLQSSIIGPVNPGHFADLESRPASSANALFIALSGRGPTKYADRIGPILIATVPIYFELPRLVTTPSQVASASVEVESPSGVTSQPLDFIEDLASVATENHRRTLPLIYTRTLIRAALKSTLSATATEITRRNASDRDSGWIQVVGALAGLVYVMTTERADLRSWIFLPGQARVTLLNLPPGPCRARIVFRSASGGVVYTTEWSSLSITEDGLATLIAQYWN